MEKILELKNKINNLLDECRSNKAEITKRERFVEERKATISSSASGDKEKIKNQLSILLKDIQAIWYKVKEQCRKAKLSFNVDELKTESLKIDGNDPLATINMMLERFENDMKNMKSAYDITPVAATNANGLIYLIQRYLNNSSELDNAYWSGGRKDPESMRALDEIREIENHLADVIDQVFTLHAELKVLVDNYNSNITETSDPVYRKVEIFDKPIKLVLGAYLGVEEKITFNLDSIAFELEELEVLGFKPYVIKLGNRTDVNEAMMFVLNDSGEIENFKSFIRDRINECYPENGLEIIEDVYDLNLAEVENVLDYNINHDDDPAKLTFLLIQEMEDFTKDLLIGQCFIVFVCSKEEAAKYKENITYSFEVDKEDDGKFTIIDSKDSIIHTM